MTLTWIGATEFLGIGCVIGFIGGVLGIGGGLIAIPTLGALFGMTEQAAQGTSIVMVLSNLLLGAWNYHRRGMLDLSFALRASITAFPATVAGGLLAIALPSRDLRIAFGIFLLVLALESIRRNYFLKAMPSTLTIKLVHMLALGISAGFCSGLFGVGGALFAVPILVYGFGLSQMRAQGTALLIVLPSVLTNIVVYGLAHDIYWLEGALLAFGGAFMVRYGVMFAAYLGERRLKVTFAGMLLACSAVLLR